MPAPASHHHHLSLASGSLDRAQAISPEWILLRVKNMLVHRAGSDPTRASQLEFMLRQITVGEALGGVVLIVGDEASDFINENDLWPSVIEAWKVHDPLGREPAAVASAHYNGLASDKVLKAKKLVQSALAILPDYESIKEGFGDIYSLRKGGDDQLTQDDIRFREFVSDTLLNLSPTARETFKREVRAAAASIAARETPAQPKTGTVSLTTRTNSPEGIEEHDPLLEFRGREQFADRIKWRERPDDFILRVYGDPTEVGLRQGDFARLDPKLYGALRRVKSLRGLKIDLATRDDDLKGLSADERLERIRKSQRDYRQRLRGKTNTL